MCTSMHQTNMSAFYLCEAAPDGVYNRWSTRNNYFVITKVQLHTSDSWQHKIITKNNHSHVFPPLNETESTLPPLNSLYLLYHIAYTHSH